MKLYLFSTFLLFFTCSLMAQVGVGTTSPNGSLDVVSTDDGLLIPRISLTATNVATVITPTISELVYNTATSGVGINQVTPGYYYWDGSLWIRLATGNATSGWALTGNAGTTAATNFLGTTDDIDLVFRRNNIRAGFIGNPTIVGGNKNTSFGANSLNAASTGIRNTAIGTNVMPSNTTGQLNVSIGDQSMFLNTTGTANTVIGVGALYSNTSGIQNVALGRNALTNANASSNTALGFATLRQNATGANNVAIGHQAGYNETGSNKLYIEMSTAANGTDSSIDNALIYGEFDNRIVRTNGTIQVGNPATTGYAFPTNRGTNGQFLQTNGAGATSWASAISNDWSITGNSGLFSATNFLGTTDGVDVAFRRNNLAAGRIGATSTSFGLGALTSGSATTSSAFGNNALAANTSGAANVAVGTGALAAVTTTGNNTAIGFNSLLATTGADNTAIGNNAGATLTTGNNNIMLGANTVAPALAGSDQLNIGNTVFGTMAGALTAGVNTTRTIGINSTTPQGALDIVSTNNGLLIPRVNLLIGANSSLPVTTIQTSEIIYNTNTVGAGVNAVTPGFYFWNGTSWVRFSTGTATGWLTTGNAGLTAGTNFIGTTDGVDVSFRRNNTAAGFIGASNVAYGLSTLSAPSLSGIRNTAFGTNALAANDSPNDNTAIGFNALAVNTFNSGGGNQNTAVGSGALATLNGGIGNTAVGFNALNASVTTSQFNTAVGAGALSRTNVAASQDNVAIGYNSLSQTATFTRTVAIGSNALVNASGNNTRNTAIGAFAGSATTTGNDNVFIGNAAGSAEAGTSSNKLYIENTNADASNALIYGEFDTNILRVNGTLQVNNPGGANGYALPNVRGTVGQLLRTDGAGATSWVSAATVETDPQVSSATVNRMPKWNGTTLVDGIVTDNGTTVTVAGTTSTTNFQMTTGATANYILRSDGTGNGSWVDSNVKSYVTTGAATGIYAVSLTEYTVRVFNGVSEVRLPNAAGNTGKIYVIIGSNTIGPKIFSTSGGIIYNDVGNVLITTLNANTRYTVQSDGTDWIVIGQ